MTEGKLSSLLTTYGIMLMGYSAWLYPPIQRWLGTKVSRMHAAGLLSSKTSSNNVLLAVCMCCAGLLLIDALLHICAAVCLIGLLVPKCLQPVSRLGLVAAILTCMFIPLAHTALGKSLLLSNIVIYSSMAFKAVCQCNAFTGSIVSYCRQE
jgi:hypothetical protein